VPNPEDMTTLGLERGREMPLSSPLFYRLGNRRQFFRALAHSYSPNSDDEAECLNQERRG
jgi:hypothetical protein